MLKILLARYRAPILLALLTGLGVVVGCGSSRQGHGDVQPNSADSWQYPVRLGDPQERVHELLGAASRATSDLEEYPLSGLTAWFDSEGRVTKFNFAGEASALYSSDPFRLIPSDRQVLFGLTGHTDEAGFRRLLGVPMREHQERSTSFRELRCIWRREGYVIDALFLIAERAHEGKTYRKGTLLWFEVSRAL